MAVHYTDLRALTETLGVLGSLRLPEPSLLSSVQAVEALHVPAVDIRYDLSDAGLPPLYGDVSSAARTLIAHTDREDVIANVADTLAAELIGLREAFPRGEQYRVGASYRVDEKWGELYRPEAPSIAVLMPYGLVGSSLAGMAAAREAMSNPRTPNIVFVPAAPGMFSYDAHGNFFVHQGLIVDPFGSIHAGRFPNPIGCATVVPGEFIRDFAAEFKAQSFCVIGSQEAMAITRSKHDLKQFLKRFSVNTPKGIIIREGATARLEDRISSLLAKRPQSSGWVVKPESDAQGTGVRILLGHSLARQVEQAARKVLAQYGSVVIEERIESFSSLYAPHNDCNFRILRAPGESDWLGIELRAGVVGSAVNLHAGARAMRWQPESLMELLEISSAEALSLYTKIDRRLRGVAQRVADAIGGDVVAIDVIVDSMLSPFVNEAAVVKGGGIPTLAKLPGSLETRLESGGALFRSLARRSKQEVLGDPCGEMTIPTALYRSPLAALFCGFTSLGWRVSDDAGPVIAALRRCVDAISSELSTLDRDGMTSWIVRACAADGQHEMLRGVLADVGREIERMPKTLVAVSLYLVAHGDMENARSIAAHLQRYCPPSSDEALSILELYGKGLPIDLGYIAETIRFQARTSPLGEFPEVQVALGLMPKPSARAAWRELGSVRRDPIELVQEAKYWRSRGRYALAEALVERATECINDVAWEYLDRYSVLARIIEEKKALQPFLPPPSSSLDMTSALLSLGWIHRRMRALFDSARERIALHALLKHQWRVVTRGEALWDFLEMLVRK